MDGVSDESDSISHDSACNSSPSIILSEDCSFSSWKEFSERLKSMADDDSETWLSVSRVLVTKDDIDGVADDDESTKAKDNEEEDVCGLLLEIDGLLNDDAVKAGEDEDAMVDGLLDDGALKANSEEDDDAADCLLDGNT